jgi:hypothetical protein
MVPVKFVFYIGLDRQVRFWYNVIITSEVTLCETASVARFTQPRVS